jgi:hypothetical protein
MFKYLRKKYDTAYTKYNIQSKLSTIITSSNVKIFAWIFIASRLYKIYQGVKYFFLILVYRRDNVN